VKRRVYSKRREAEFRGVSFAIKIDTRSPAEEFTGNFDATDTSRRILINFGLIVEASIIFRCGFRSRSNLADKNTGMETGMGTVKFTVRLYHVLYRVRCMAANYRCAAVCCTHNIEFCSIANGASILTRVYIRVRYRTRIEQSHCKYRMRLCVRVIYIIHIYRFLVYRLSALTISSTAEKR